MDYLLVLIAVLPGLHGFACRMRRGLNARKAAVWVRDEHEKEWSTFHWLAQGNPWAGIEALIAKGVISASEVG